MKLRLTLATILTLSWVTASCGAQRTPAEARGQSPTRFAFEQFLGARMSYTGSKPTVVFCRADAARAATDGVSLQGFLPELANGFVTDTACTDIDGLVARHRPTNGLLLVDSIRVAGDSLLIFGSGHRGGRSQRELAAFVRGGPLQLNVSNFTVE